MQLVLKFLKLLPERGNIIQPSTVDAFVASSGNGKSRLEPQHPRTTD